MPCFGVGQYGTDCEHNPRSLRDVAPEVPQEDRQLCLRGGGGYGVFLWSAQARK